MPVEINILSQRYGNKYNSGYTENLVGCVGEKITVFSEVELFAYADGKQFSPFDIVDNGGDSYNFKKANGSFRPDGFYNGCNVVMISLDNPSSTITGTIVYFSETWITVQFISSPGTILTSNNLRLINLEAPTGVIFSPNLIENTENFNIVSKVTDGDVGYYLGDISTSYKSMLPLGNYKDFTTGNVALKSEGMGGLGRYKFVIRHDFIITPFYIEAWNEAINGTETPELFNGINSLKYVMSFDFRKALSNPNTSRVGKNDTLLGSVGWFNENFNGFNNKYKVKSVDYYNNATGGGADGLLVSDKTKVEIVVKSIGAIKTTDKIGLYVFKLQKESEYQNKQTSLTSNFLYYSQVVPIDNVEESSNILSVKAQKTASNEVTITGYILYTIAQQLQLTENDEYALGVGITDMDLTIGNSDRVILLADVNKYDKNADIDGLLGVDSLDLQMYNDVLETPENKFTSLVMWNEDGIKATFDFWLDTAKNALLNSLEFVLCAYNDYLDEYFILDSYTLPTNGSIVGGVQMLEYTGDRGYHLPIDAKMFNDVILSVGANNSGKQHYSLEIGQKISWQDWISNLDVPLSFFDSSKPNDNRNNKSSNYQGNGYTIRIGLKANVFGTDILGNSGNTDYLIMSPSNDIYDYEKPTEWSAEIKTFRASNMADLNGNVLQDENTLFKTIWTHSSGAVSSVADMTGEHGIQNNADNGYNTDITVTGFEVADNNKLKKISPLALDSGKVVTECLIDGSKINSLQDLTAKLLVIKPIISQDNKVTSPDGIQKDTENDTKDIS